MRYARDYRVGVEELGYGTDASIKALLVFMEDAACWHSALAGYGVREVETKQRAWVVLDWKVKIHEIPVYEQILNVSTWSRKMDGIRAYRDYEVKDETGKIIVSATSRWILTDTQRRRPVRLTDDIVQAYETDGTYTAFDEEIEKLEYDEDMIENSVTTNYNVRRSDIDVNRHVHNIQYIDIAYEAMPDEVFFDFIKGRYRNFHILYKKEIMYKDTVVCKYFEKNGQHTIVMFVDDEMHAMMTFNA